MARDAVERALALDPELADVNVVQGRLHLYLRRGPEALRAFERALAAARQLYEFRSRHDSPRGLEGHALYHHRPADEIRALNSKRDLPPDRQPYLAALEPRSGNTAPAETILSRLEPEEAPLTVALLAAVLGREELATVRAQPRYRRLLRDVEREWGMAADGDDANSAI